MSESQHLQVVPSPIAITDWVTRYVELAVVGVRSGPVTDKIRLHLERFRRFFVEAYGHERLCACVRRDVLAWRLLLREHGDGRAADGRAGGAGEGAVPATPSGFAASTVNNHLASLSAFMTWVETQAPGTFVAGDPTKGVGELPLPPLEPRTLGEAQLRSLKSVCDRLVEFHRLRGRRHAADEGERPQRKRGRPWRDRAIVFVLLSTGLRREELVRLDVAQLEPRTVDELRSARRARIRGVCGKGGNERTVFLSSDARLAVADYLERERVDDAADEAALFVAAAGNPSRRADGRLSVSAINQVITQIGRWHDGEIRDPSKHISPLRPHDLRHCFAFMLARETGADAYELERRLGHRSQRYIQRYTNPPEDVAAGYVEGF